MRWKGDIKEKQFLRQEAGLGWREVWRAARAEAYNRRELGREVSRIARPARRLLVLGTEDGLLPRLLGGIPRPGGAPRRVERTGILPPDPTPGRRCFDLVLVYRALEVLEADDIPPGRFLAGAMASVRPGGRLLLVERALDGVADDAGEHLAAHLRAALRSLAGRTLYGPHRLGDYADLAAGAGLTVTRRALIGRDPGPRPNRVLAARLARERAEMIGFVPPERRGDAERLIDGVRERIAATRGTALPWALLVAERAKAGRAR